MIRVLIALGLICLTTSVQAQPVVLATPLSDDGAVVDQPRGGAAETLQDFPFVLVVPSVERRGFIEWDTSLAARAPLSSATLRGRVSVNNSLSVGTRTIELSVYAADGTVALDDFDRAVTPVTTVSYTPPADTFVAFDLDVLSEITPLLASGATHIGLRGRSTVNDAANVLTMVELVLETLCGNDAVDSPEECDTGASLSDTAADACRLDCTDASCGDSVIDTGETCDDGPLNSDTAADACRLDCDPARCGDNVVDMDEACDDGPTGSATCTTECTVVVDAGLPPADSGTPPADSGAPPADSGTPPADSGTPPADSAVSDAGTDGGTIPPAISDGGCGCRMVVDSRPNSALGVLASLLVFGVWARRRRRA
ncbi:MAG: hypothetical protein DRJ42_21245 [Deltaproteobacteria bacterium]|nr:MAG: hypothetical protein DRJ42_21245 [Deltaproteobacteria bacterium]